MSLPRYREYKDSGVSWLGNVPKHWGVKKLGYEFLEPPCYGVLVPDFEIGGVPMIRIMDMQCGKVVREELTTISHDLSNQYSRTLTKSGDVLLSVVGTIGEIVHVDDHLAGVNLSRAVARLQPKETTLNRRFLGWLFQSTVFETYVDLICVGSAQRVLNMGDLSSLRVGLPPPVEQTAIAAFLDRETAKIDALIAEQEKLIALLAEKRQATISHAVTRGLNPDAPMKDSGVAWLGEVPAHWNVVPLKYLVELRSGGTPSKDNLSYWGGDIPWASAKDLKVEKLESTIDYITQNAVDTGAASLIRAGAVLVVVRGMILARMFPVVETTVPMAINQDLKAILPIKRLNTPFLAWLLRGSAEESLQRLDEAGHGTKALRMDAWTSIPLPVPPLEEQVAVSDYLSETTVKLDALRDHAEQVINLLKERRSALIAAAVTGQIDVRDAAERACT